MPTTLTPPTPAPARPHPIAGCVRDGGGWLPLDGYGALGDGRSIALSGADGSIDWWAVPNIDSPPLLDRLLDAPDGGRFVIAPCAPFTAERRYREGSNVLETVFTTADGHATLTESLNSGSAGRLPWAELARRVDGGTGSVRFRVELSFSRSLDKANSWTSPTGGRQVFHIGSILGVFIASDGIAIERQDDEGIAATFAVGPGDRRTVAIVAGDDEPLVVPPIADIDGRIDLADEEWRQWSGRIVAAEPRRALVLRSALALKLLLFSPTGAIAAAATTSLPERIGGSKNYDYRFAWVRDAGYTVRAFLRLGAHAEAKAGLTWLLDRLDRKPHVAYRLDGHDMQPATAMAMPGWRDTSPVMSGNDAADQLQLGLFGDIFETAAAFVETGILDSHSAATLSALADRCADVWRLKDAGIWELDEPQHFTMSKISAWQALARAVEMADAGHLPATCRARWARERDRIAAWVDEHCWSQARGAYTFFVGSGRLDASLALAVRFGFAARGADSADRLRSTLDAIDRELGAGPFHYRYGGAQEEEGCFLACSFWMAEARALLGETGRAARDFDALAAALDRGVGVLTEMIDPASGELLGNLPQGLTHLALVNAAAALADAGARDT
ncbi:glycoside hydrolase family 15 protein [Sphingomonas bacterium]|uniref:glycoside hydrolase family 15 protein n=1 Tax=Sphingomonas bacterium TaxID=1895847 RepID=UPI001576C6E0|nr:glycoside hydrolase family 15 protein [Sphingomonas bacterium]